MYQKTTENGTSTILFIIFLFMNFILLPNMVKYVTTINAINILEERKKKKTITVSNRRHINERYFVMMINKYLYSNLALISLLKRQNF